MPTDQTRRNTYLENKGECKEIIDVLIGNMGITQNNENKTLRRSSKEALKSVFKDPEMGQDALDYFRKLKTTANEERLNNHTTDVQQQAAEIGYADLANAVTDNELKQRASDVQSLLSDNTRNLKSKDFFNSRVVGKKKANMAAGLAVASVAGIAGTGGIAAGVTVPFFAATIAAPTLESIGAAATAGLVNLATAYYSLSGTALPILTRQENQKGKRVTKINPEKKVNTDSKGIDDKYKSEMRQYQDLQLDYKDVLYEKMTGQVSKNYHIATSKLGHAVDSYVGVLDGMAKGKTQDKAAKDVNSHKVQETPSGIAKEITSFIAGRSKSSFAEQVDSSRNNSARSHE